MAYSAYCDTATHTKWWITGTGSSVNRLSEVMDDNASGVEEDDNPGNYQPWSEFMTETVEDGIYLIHQNLEIGDASTATTLTSLNESVVFDTGKKFTILQNATLTLGTLHNGWGIEGSRWVIAPAASGYINSNGTLNLYGSTIKNDSNFRIDIGGASTVFNCYSSTIAGNYNVGSSTSNIFYVLSNVSPENIVVKRSTFSDFGRVYWYNAGTIEQLHIHSVYIMLANARASILENAYISDLGLYFQVSSWHGGHFFFRNLFETVENATKFIEANNHEIVEEYSVDLCIVDGDGNAVEGAVVSITDDHGNLVSYIDSTATLSELLDNSETGVDVSDGTKFAEGDVIRINNEYMTVSSIATNTLTVSRGTWSTYYPVLVHELDSFIYITGTLETDASGDTTRCWLPYKFWEGTSETEYNPNPYTITISKAGYETLILENITIDSPIDWHLELQDSHPVVGELLFDTDANPHLLIAEQIITDVC